MGFNSVFKVLTDTEPARNPLAAPECSPKQNFANSPEPNFDHVNCSDVDAQDMILDDITRKQLIWYGHVERMDPTRLPRIMIHWKPEGRKQRGRPRRT